jgi:hypothetical protein
MCSLLHGSSGTIFAVKTNCTKTWAGPGFYAYESVIANGAGYLKCARGRPEVVTLLKWTQRMRVSQMGSIKPHRLTSKTQTTWPITFYLVSYHFPFKNSRPVLDQS